MTDQTTTKRPPNTTAAHNRPAPIDHAATFSDKFAQFRPCGCTGDPLGCEPPKRHPDCRVHADHVDPEACIDCGGCGEIQAGFDSRGIAYAQGCPACAGTARRSGSSYTRKTAAEIAETAAPGVVSAGHLWRRDGYGVNGSPDAL